MLRRLFRRWRFLSLVFSFFMACLVFALGACSHADEETIARLTDENAELARQVEALTENLEEANANIRDAANDIEDVQLYQYGDCQTLRFKVGLIDVPTEVDEP